MLEIGEFIGQDTMLVTTGCELKALGELEGSNAMIMESHKQTQ